MAVGLNSTVSLFPVPVIGIKLHIIVPPIPILARQNMHTKTHPESTLLDQINDSD